MRQKCDRCNGSGYANAARDSGMESAPSIMQPMGVYTCPICDGEGSYGFDEEDIKEMAKKLDEVLSPEQKQALAELSKRGQIIGEGY